MPRPGAAESDSAGHDSAGRGGLIEGRHGEIGTEFLHETSSGIQNDDIEGFGPQRACVRSRWQWTDRLPERDPSRATTTRLSRVWQAVGEGGVVPDFGG